MTFMNTFEIVSHPEHPCRFPHIAEHRAAGVLTKLDIMDKGTDARDVLEGKSVRLKHGWVAVVNRGQADLNSKMAMGDSRKRELEFFSTNPAYAGVQNIGTTFLSNKLSSHLIGAIRKQLPVIQTAINNGYARARTCSHVIHPRCTPSHVKHLIQCQPHECRLCEGLFRPLWLCQAS